MNLKTYHGVKLYEGIVEQLLNIHSTEIESMEEIKRYVKEFPREVDYNIVMYGNLLCYYYQVRNFYKSCSYPTERLERMNDSDLWDMYKKDVRFVVDDFTNGILTKKRSLYEVLIPIKYNINKMDVIRNIADWIHWNKDDALRLDDSKFITKPNDKQIIVSLLYGNETIESFCNDVVEESFFKHTNLDDGILIEVDNNIYLCTFTY